MTHQTQITSLLAYQTVLTNLGDRQVEVYKAIRRLGSCSSTMISKNTGLPINCVVPRVNEMVKLGVLIEARKGVCEETGFTVIFWKCVRKL